jgi:type VI secretion system protein VasD
MKTQSSIQLFRLIVISLSIAVLASCGSAPPKKHSLEIRISAATDVNPDLQTRPSPIILHMLELTAIDGFNSADFFALTQDDAAALGGDVLNKTEIILTPGSSQERVLDLDQGTAYLGFVAAYRDIDTSRWRVSQAVVPGKTDWISVNLGHQQISINEVND